ncbi:MAG: hypothetical protein ABI222_12985 [Opitutaceae bacterium]
MKKTYLYVLAPLVGLIIFGAIYWNFSKSLAKREATRVANEKAKREAKLAKQARDNEQAIKEAVASSTKRKAEREAKEAKDQANKDARAAAVEAQNKADRDQRKLGLQVDRLEKDVVTEKQAIAKLAADKTDLRAEQEFLKKYVKQAEENAHNLTQILDKISAADAARAAADAAAAAKKKS